MSDDNKFIDPIHAQIEQGALEERKKKDVQKKELIVRERNVDATLQMIEESDKNTALAKNANYGILSLEEVQKIIDDNTEYMLAARKNMRFVNKEFDNMVPFFRKNLILVGAPTGGGKSTTVANIVRELIASKDPTTGNRRKILVISNEERAEDVYNRITCLIKGWHYVNHNKFTDEQVKTFNEYIVFLSKTITVVGNDFGGSMGTTSTVEGICHIFDSLLEKGKLTGEWYDAILIDYYQKIYCSRLNPKLDPYQVQSMLSKKLDQYKNSYPAPIVLMAQVRKPTTENPIDFKIRVEGSKEITNVATCAIEMEPNAPQLSSEWTIHKSRFNEKLGDSITTGYKDGRYVEHNDAFKAMVAQRNAARERDEMNKTIGHIPEVKEEGDKEDE